MLNFKDYLTSPPFEFIVGSNRRSFFINASLIASQSKPLTSLVSGSGGGSSPERGQMRESIERRAILDEVDEDTFARFVEFALTNSYTPAQPCEYASDNEDDSDLYNDSETEAEETEDEDVGGNSTGGGVFDGMKFTEIPSTDSQAGGNRKRRKGRKKEAHGAGVGKRTKSTTNTNYKFPPSPVSSSVDSDNEHHTRTASDVSTMVLNTSAPTARPQQAVNQRAVMYGRFTAGGPVFATGTQQQTATYGYGIPASMNTGRRPTSNSFTSLPYGHAPPAREVPPVQRPNGLDEDYTPVFLSHAKLYVFAEKYDVSNLRALTLHNLHACLSQYNVYPDPDEGDCKGHGAKDIVNLINYAYENTMNDEGEELRKVVSWFCAWRAKQLLKCKFYCGCLELGAMGVGFVRDLVGKLASMAPADD